MRAQHIGYSWPAFDLVIERGSAIAFARGLDETNPIYLDEAAAGAAGAMAAAAEGFLAGASGAAALAPGIGAATGATGAARGATGMVLAAVTRSELLFIGFELSF